MKYTVQVADRTLDVEIEDINARPVVAHIDGQRFEITPEAGSRPSAPTTTAGAAALPHGAAIQQMSGSSMLSPLPGTVTEVFVKPGEKVEAGEVLLVIEAMKMKNSIRSVRSGLVGEVLVSPGQSIAHRQPLVTYAESGEASWI
ncbi:MAG: biotin/lipoyl-containing protein [Bacteroidota bacterium]